MRAGFTIVRSSCPAPLLPAERGAQSDVVHAVSRAAGSGLADLFAAAASAPVRISSGLRASVPRTGGFSLCAIPSVGYRTLVRSLG